MSDKKYIELGKIIDAILSIPVPADSYFAQITDAGKKLCVSVVQNVQSADVAPVVHGYWKKHPHSDDKYEFYTCSCCRSNLSPSNDYRFCPDCGAKMDEEVK